MSIKHIILVATLLILSRNPAIAGAQEVDNPLSASTLGERVGLQITNTLVIGDLERIKRGEIPLAHTNPETMGNIRIPANVPTTYPLAREKKFVLEDFDAKLFYNASFITPELGDDDVYTGLFRPGDERYSLSQLTLRPVVWSEKLTFKNDSRRNKETRKTAERRGRVRQNKENGNHEPAQLQWVTKGKTKEYF